MTYTGIHRINTRLSSANTGDLRFNADTKNMELYDGKSWTIVVDELYEAKLEIITGEEKFGDCYYWVQVNVPGLFSERREKNIEIHDWVVQTYGPSSTWGYGRWCDSDYRYWFKEEKDRAWFILKWTE